MRNVDTELEGPSQGMLRAPHITNHDGGESIPVAGEWVDPHILG